MADADGKFIEYVEDDMGEGVRDFYEPSDQAFETMRKLQNARAEIEKEIDRKCSYPGKEITLNDVMNKLDRIELALDRIFGDHILINGKWVDMRRALAE